LEGEHDFTSFCAADDASARRVVQLRGLTLRKCGEQIQIQIEASHFLKQMVRNLVGFLVEVGRGRRSVDEIAGIFKARDRRKAGPTAPPQGLFLMAVLYGGSRRPLRGLCPQSLPLKLRKEKIVI
jgi:tRNA pseudouridine38-40 synthase